MQSGLTNLYLMPLILSAHSLLLHGHLSSLESEYIEVQDSKGHVKFALNSGGSGARGAGGEGGGGGGDSGGG